MLSLGGFSYLDLEPEARSPVGSNKSKFVVVRLVHSADGYFVELDELIYRVVYVVEKNSFFFFILHIHIYSEHVVVVEEDLCLGEELHPLCYISSFLFFDGLKVPRFIHFLCLFFVVGVVFFALILDMLFQLFVGYKWDPAVSHFFLFFYEGNTEVLAEFKKHDIMFQL